MNKHAVHAVLARALCIAVVAVVAACTPLQVVTHTVSQSETRVPPGQYELDPHHWSITFDVDHFKYSRFTMRFDRTTAQLDWSEGGLNRSSLGRVHTAIGGALHSKCSTTMRSEGLLIIK